MNCLLGEPKGSANSNSTTTTNSNSKICNNFNITQNISHAINPQETCLICGDVASGKHYGLRSCEACKAFFKRTVQGKIEYSCPATRSCEINKRRRKACQACRFQKCLNMGMLKEGVRLDRVRGGRQKYRRGLSPGSGNTTTGESGKEANSNTSCTSGAIISGPNNVQRNSTSSVIGCPKFGSAETNRIMTALISCEPEELTASPAQIVTNIPSTLSFQMKTLYILSDLFDRELVSLIGWAKQVPGFSETITLNDQMRLLQSTWAEVIALSIGYRSYLRRLEGYGQSQQQQHMGIGGLYLNTSPSPTSSSPASTTSSYNHNSNSNSVHNLENTEIRLVFAKDLMIDYKHAVACGAEEIFYNCVQLIKRLDYLNITPKEYIIMKAICLTNADVRLENPKSTHQLRDLIMDTLYEATILDSSSISSNTSSPSTSSSATAINSVSLRNFGQKDNNSNDILISGRVKSETHERPISSMNHYASSSPPRPSSSMLSSSSLSSISSHNNNNTNVDINSANRKAIINNRLNQVLLCLPVLRQIDSCIRKFWNDVRKGPNNVPMNKLFEEMLEPCQRIYKSSNEM